MSWKYRLWTTRLEDETASEGAGDFEDVVKAIEAKGFAVQKIYSGWICATHKHGSKRLIIRVLERRELGEYPDAKGMIFTLGRFKVFLGYLTQHLFNRLRKPVRLDVGTLVDFGWRAKLDASSRQGALQMTISYNGEVHIHHTLIWLLNMFSQDMNKSDVVISSIYEDIHWIESEYSSTSLYWAARKKLQREFAEITGQFPMVRERVALRPTYYIVVI